jgi:hypothetical protein
MNLFKELFMKPLIAALALLGTLTATAQTMKWSYFLTNPLGWTADGHGGLAALSHTVAGDELAIVSWVEPTGRTLFTNVIAHTGVNFAGSTIRIVRFNKSELAVQVQANYEYAPGTNFLRRFRRNGTYSDTALEAGEEMEPQSNVLADNRGFFTYQRATNGNDFVIRRYSN